MVRVKAETVYDSEGMPLLGNMDVELTPQKDIKSGDYVLVKLQVDIVNSETFYDSEGGLYKISEIVAKVEPEKKPEIDWNKLKNGFEPRFTGYDNAAILADQLNRLVDVVKDLSEKVERLEKR